MKNERDFTDSFLWRVPLRKGRKHSLKSHAKRGTLVYEVLGILDLLASKDPKHRFVFAERPTILKLCNKGRRVNGKQYSMSMLQRVLAELQARHIVSPYFKAWDGRFGFVVEPHDARCQVINNVCIKYAPKRFESHPAVTSPVTRLSPEVSPACHLNCHPMGEKKSPDLSPQLSPDAPPQPCEFTNFTEEDAAKWLAERGLIGAPSRVVSQPWNRKEPIEPYLSGDQAHVQRQEQQQPQGQKRTGVSFPLRLTDSEAKSKPADIRESIGEHFVGDVTITALSNAELDDACIPHSWQETDKDDFEECMMQAVAAKSARPYCGNITHAALMGDTMRLFLETYSRDAPPPWYPVMKLLRANPLPQEKLPPSCKPEALSRLASQPSPWHKEHGYELCGDVIWRAEVDRLANGFTVKGDDGVWRKP